MWSTVFTRTEGGVTLLLSKGWQAGQALYSVKIGIEKPDRDSHDKTFLSPFIPLKENDATAANVRMLLAAANLFIAEDKCKDGLVEKERAQALSKKPNPGLTFKHKGLKALAKADKAKRITG